VLRADAAGDGLRTHRPAATRPTSTVATTGTGLSSGCRPANSSVTSVQPDSRVTRLLQPQLRFSRFFIGPIYEAEDVVESDGRISMQLVQSIESDLP
jgi:hypothetical protein